jgi:hypothetical protein
MAENIPDGDDLLDAALGLLVEAREWDAHDVLESCRLKCRSGPQVVDITLSCPSTVYEMLTHPTYPIQQQIANALSLTLEEDYSLGILEIGKEPIPFDDSALEVEVLKIKMRYLETSSASDTGVTDVESSALTPGAADDLCFVIMSFSSNPQLRDFYEKAIKPTVEALGFRCKRVDEQYFNGSIRENILANIRQAKFILVDLTEARPNCYYELGLAQALEKPVILLARRKEDVHFDVSDFPVIIYERLDPLVTRLRERIQHTILQK